MTNILSYLTLINVINVHFYFVHGFRKSELDSSYNGLSYPFQYFTRDEWEADPPTNVRPLTKPVPYVVIHHTYIPSACNTTEKCFRAMRSMQNYHNSLGWGDIGYNYCVGSMGDVFEGRGWNNVGVHAGRANNFSIGICLIGDWRVATPPEPMLETTKKLISVGVENGSISPVYKLVGHKQTMTTECPGSALANIISTWDHYTKEILKF
ncbi:unnamed protein product [Parnassius mnemosyne]|uniref:Peptidoglycan-recognition protein n=1 Tax=Parnassius mnemosyne TaxID=213953 RepID=A0AAV1L4W4_9NEOP